MVFLRAVLATSIISELKITKLMSVQDTGECYAARHIDEFIGELILQ